MPLTDRIKSSYLRRMDDLIAEGTAIPLTSHSRQTGGNYISGEKYYHHYQLVSLTDWVAWRTSCVAVMEQIVPAGSALHASVVGFVELDNKPSTREHALGFVRAVRRELESGSLDMLALRIEAELLADYLDQAQALLDEPADNFTFAAAAVVAGAALERSLRAICAALEPPESLNDAKGNPLTLGGLLDALKRRGTYNELQAKELRAWAALRNHAAHGQFDEFTRGQVDSMVAGIRRFTAEYVR